MGKATVYRWWPNKGALVVDAFASSTEHKLHFPDTGSVYQDMSLQMNQFLGILRTRRGRIVAALVGGGQSDPELLEAFRERFLRPRRQEAYKTLRRGIERGELPASLDLDLVLDTLYGAIYMRFLIRHDELSEELCEAGLPDGAGRGGREFAVARLAVRVERSTRRLDVDTHSFAHYDSFTDVQHDFALVSRFRVSRSDATRIRRSVLAAGAGLLSAGDGDDHFRRSCRSETLPQRHQDAGCSRHGGTRRRDQGTGQGFEISSSTATRSLGLQPAGTNGYLQPFTVTTGAKLKSDNSLTEEVSGKKQALVLNQDFVPASFSSSGAFTGPVVFVGYGASADEFQYDDYAGVDVKDKIVVVLRYEPEIFGEKSGHQGLTQHSQLITKAINARNHGAKAVVLHQRKAGRRRRRLADALRQRERPAGRRHHAAAGEERGRRELVPGGGQIADRRSAADQPPGQAGIVCLSANSATLAEG